MNQKVLILYFVFGTACCIILGMIFFGLDVFNIRSPFFQFTSYGITGSVSFVFFQAKKIRDAFFLNILLFLVLYFLAGRQNFLTHLLHYTAVILAVFFYSKNIYSKMTQLNFIRPLVLAGIFSILFILVSLILTLIFYSDSLKVLPLKNMPVGFLMGLSLAAGFEMAEYSGSRK